ncbi:MAG: LemA family protein [Patescibacteria group bacterium]
MKKTIWVILGVVIIIVAWLWSSYNKLVTANEGVDGQWAQVETQYQRRFDLIPNFVASVKGAMEQEQTVFGDLAEARTRYSGAQSVNDKATAATEVESALSRLLVVMENYPELKSMETVQTLMAQLEGAENRVSVERGRFNDAVRSFNVMTKRIPTNIIANWFGFSEKNYFEAVEAAAEAPVVNLELND